MRNNSITIHGSSEWLSILSDMATALNTTHGYSFHVSHPEPSKEDTLVIEAAQPEDFYVLGGVVAAAYLGKAHKVFPHLKQTHE